MPKPKYLSENGLLYLWQRIAAIFATKSEVGDENVIETVKVNNTALTPDANKAVNIDLSGKADVATTLAGYGITDAYTKTEANNTFATKGEAGDDNVIETVKVDNTALTPDGNKAVNIDLSGKANVATTLAGYGITNAYTKTETDSAIANAIGGITGLSFEVVQTLPASGEAGKIYLKPNSGSGTNIYDEYIYYNNAWEMIGTTAVDLSNYINVNDELTNSEIAEIIGS